MKKFYAIFTFLSLILFTSCHHTSTSSSTNSSLPSYTSIHEMLQNGEGNYLIRGKIVKIQTSQSTNRIWIQNQNQQNQTEAILLSNCSNVDTLNVSEMIAVQGNYLLKDYLPTMEVETITKIEGGEEISINPIPYTANEWENLTQKNLNQYITLENVHILSMNELDYSLTITWENLFIPLIVDCYQEVLTADLFSFLKENMANKKEMNINGMIDITSDGNQYRLKVVDYTDVSFVDSSQEKTISLYGINDFHGAVLENDNEMEIVQLGSYLKTKKAHGNTLLINSGDFWQGSIESNYNYGALLTDCMNEIEFDCFTLGNHEFDWGASMIEKNQKRKAIDGYQTPFLAANVYDYDIESKTIGPYANLGKQYTIKTLENGLKVGIIGVIGKDQITSISSQHVDDYIFVEPIEVIQDLSDELKAEKDVDVIIVDCHTDQNTITNNSSQATITTISPVSKQRYVDAVFCAHTHQNESQMINGVPFIQTNGYGKAISNIELKVDENGTVSCTTYKNLYSSSIDVEIVDDNLTQIVQEYQAITDKVGQEVLTQVSDTLTSNETLVHVVTTAMAEYAIQQDIKIDYAISNLGRASIAKGDLTYAKLYRSLPFDNEIYIIETSGRYLLNQLEYSSNLMYRLDDQPLYSNETYTIAILDYLALHRNTNREYNYYPDAKIIGKFTHDDYELFNYRDLTAEYLRNLDLLDPQFYTHNQLRHNKDLLNQAVIF